MAAVAQYASTVKGAAVQITTASPGVLNATSAVGTLVIAAGSLGTRIDDLYIQAVGSTSAGMIRFFLSDGSTYSRLLLEVPVQTVTQSSTSAGFSTRLTSLAWVIPNGMQLRATSEVANTFNIIVTRAGDF